MTLEIVRTIKMILDQSKIDNEVSDSSSLNIEILEQLGLPDSTPFSIDRKRRIALALSAVTHGVSFAEIVDLLTWKDFEGFVAEILSENSFRCVEMEIDVVGVKGHTIIAIDAKMWGVRNGKGSALKTAAQKQKKRTQDLTWDLDRLSKKLSSLNRGIYTIFPVIVTWLVEEVELHEGVPVVPVFKLNSFILDMDQYEDIVVSYSGQLES